MSSCPTEASTSGSSKDKQGDFADIANADEVAGVARHSLLNVFVSAPLQEPPPRLVWRRRAKTH